MGEKQGIMYRTGIKITWKYVNAAKFEFYNLNRTIYGQD
jgi:hypothetical protein